MSATLNPKSKAGDGKCFLWMMIDKDGVYKAVCFEAKSVTELLSDGFMAAAANRSRDQFVKAGVKKSNIILAP